MDKRIIIFHSSNDLYGASKILLQIIKLLKQNGFETHVFLPYKGPLDDILLENNVILNHSNFGVLRRRYFNFFGLLNRLLKILCAVIEINNYIKKNNIDLAYTNTSVILASGISAKLCKIPNFLHIHEIPDNKFYTKILGSLISFFSSRVIVVSKCVRSHWDSFISQDLKIIYNGIPLINKKIIPKNSSKKIKFLTLARLLPYKGHKYIIEIANHLIKKGLDIEFIFVGDVFKGYESYELELKSLVKLLKIDKHILFKGFDKNVEKYLTESNFLFHGAINPDPLPTVIFEAIQYNLPVISTKQGGAIEILDNGKGGLLITLKDSLKASNEIYNYITNKELIKEKTEYSINFMSKNFSKEKFENNLLKIISY